MFAWSQLDFSAISVSISVVSLTSGQTWQNVNSKRILQSIQNVQEGKRHQKKETSSRFCLCSFCFWGEVSKQLNSEWYRQKLLAGKLKENCHVFNVDFYCRSILLYMSSTNHLYGQNRIYKIDFNTMSIRAWILQCTMYICRRLADLFVDTKYQTDFSSKSALWINKQDSLLNQLSTIYV